MTGKARGVAQDARRRQGDSGFYFEAGKRPSRSFLASSLLRGRLALRLAAGRLHSALAARSALEVGLGAVSTGVGDVAPLEFLTQNLFDRARVAKGKPELRIRPTHAGV